MNVTKLSAGLVPAGLRLAGLLALGLASPISAQPAQGDDHPGVGVYQQNCAFCHDGGDARAHSLETLRQMDADSLTYALTEGVMAAQGAALEPDARRAVVDWLAVSEATEDPDAWYANHYCSADQRTVGVATQHASMPQVGVDKRASRYLSAEQAGLSLSDLEDLELAWAFGFPGVTGLRASPVVLEDTLFYSAVTTNRLLALDVESGCVKWAYESPVPLRSSVSIGEIGEEGRKTLVFGDARAQIHTVDAETGEGIWVVNAQADPGVGMITGAAVLHDDLIIVPISASGVGAGANPRHECCAGRGAVTALDAATGEKVWTYFTMEPADYTGEVNSLGVKLRGPSGAPIWTTPSVDEKRGVVYVTTGENTSLPATETSNAIIALDVKTGEPLWVFQGIADDVWNMACSTSGGRHGPNCPDEEQSILKDWDFGGSAVLVTLPDGSDLLVAGQKSGHIWALNPDNGELVWMQRAGDGSPLGGNHWGIAVDQERAFLPINDPHLPGLADYTPVPGMYAYNLKNGEPLWSHQVTADCEGREDMMPVCAEKYGLSATPLVVDGGVISAALDGRVYVFDATDGRVVFEYDTAREFDTLNGVDARGGSIDSHSIAAGAGMVFIASGYSSFNQVAGNVLLAFRPRR